MVNDLKTAVNLYLMLEDFKFMSYGTRASQIQFFDVLLLFFISFVLLKILYCYIFIMLI